MPHVQTIRVGEAVQPSLGPRDLVAQATDVGVGHPGVLVEHVVTVRVDFLGSVRMTVGWS